MVFAFLERPAAQIAKYLPRRGSPVSENLLRCCVYKDPHVAHSEGRSLHVNAPWIHAAAWGDLVARSGPLVRGHPARDRVKIPDPESGRLYSHTALAHLVHLLA